MPEAPRPRALPRLVQAGLRRLRPPTAVRAVLREQGLRFSEGNRVVLYHGGREGLAAMLEAIESARRRVHLETYILRADTTGRRFLAALAGRARAGVAVHLLVDAVGSLALPDSALRELRAAGADVVVFNPLHRMLLRWAPRRRDHRKILTVDGRVGFTGGLNIGDEYWASHRDGPDGWRDAHLRIEGPAVRDLDAVFCETWFRADGPDLPWTELVSAPAVAVGDVRCAVVADGPAHRRRRSRDLLLAGLRRARAQVSLVTPYFAPGRHVLAALAEAAGRGVAVDLLLAGATDHPWLRRAARSLVPRLLAHGVRVHEYLPAMMHAKLAVFDRDWAVVGTSNLDRQSLRHSYEVNVVLEGGELAERLLERFELDLRDSRHLTAEALALRRPGERLLDRIAAILLRLL
jgi:cardiolipin synthase